MAPRRLLKDWEAEFDRWSEPFLDALAHRVRRKWAPAYLRGLILPAERKSVVPMATRVAPGHRDALHHFVAISPWETEPLERVLIEKANALVGGEDAFLIVDDTALVKKGTHSVGVAPQYCGELGKRANCQALVSLSLARGEVPVAIGLWLYLPEAWASDKKRRRRAGVPEGIGFREKWRIALDQIDRGGETQRYHRVSDIFRGYMKRHAPAGTPHISSKDLRKSFSTLCETQLGVDGVALGSYLGHSPRGIRHQRYSDVRDIEFLRREVAEKVEGWVGHVF